MSVIMTKAEKCSFHEIIIIIIMKREMKRKKRIRTAEARECLWSRHCLFCTLLFLHVLLLSKMKLLSSLDNWRVCLSVCLSVRLSVRLSVCHVPWFKCNSLQLQTKRVESSLDDDTLTSLRYVYFSRSVRISKFLVKLYSPFQTSATKESGHELLPVKQGQLRKKDGHCLENSNLYQNFLSYSFSKMSQKKHSCFQEQMAKNCFDKEILWLLGQ